jgi:hypothetical protein
MWIGIRSSAVLTILGSVLVLLAGALMLWGVLVGTPAETATPLPLKAIGVFGGVLLAALAFWGIVTAVGIFRRRGWARVSMVVFAVLLAFMSIGGLLAILFVRMPTVGGESPRVMEITRKAIAGFYGALSIIGVWWLILFNSRGAKQYFAETVEPGLGERPLSVSIIGWYLLAVALSTAVMAVLRVPAMMFGWFATGWIAVLIYTVFTAVEVYLGTGLLQLQEHARVGSIVFFSVMAVNPLITVAAPGYAEHMQRLKTMMPRLARVEPGSPAMEASGTLMLTATAFMAIPIWFLVRRRPAFRGAGQGFR